MTVVELTVAPGDMGKVIGRQGRTAEALRTLVAATAHHHGSRRRSRFATRTCGSGPWRWDDMVLVGRIARTHGHRGQVIVNPETDFPEERFAAGATFWTRCAMAGRRAVTIAAMRMHQGRPVVALEGVETMNEAEALRGRRAAGARVGAAAAAGGARYYEHDLIGCAVVTIDGRDGRHGAGGRGRRRARSALIADGGRGEIQVPLVHEICVAIDVAHKRIVIDPPEGLLDVNA